METLRGQPTIEQVAVRLAEVWGLIPDLSFVRFMANVFASGGYQADQLNDIFFMGRINDTEIMRCLNAYEQVVKRHS